MRYITAKLIHTDFCVKEAVGGLSVAVETVQMGAEYVSTKQGKWLRLPNTSWWRQDRPIAAI